MGFFNKLNILLNTQSQQDIQEQQPENPKQGLYRRGIIFQNCTSADFDQDDSGKTLPELFFLCMERLSRSGGRNSNTALSLLKAYIPFEYGICVDIREGKNHIYTSSGIDFKKAGESIQHDIDKLIDGGCRLISEADIPASLAVRAIGELAVLPILNGEEAWIILASPKGKTHNRHIRDLFLDPSAETFLPPLASSSEKKNISLPVGEKFICLRIDNAPSLKGLMTSLSQRLPPFHYLYAINKNSYLLLAPQKEDIELLWFHISSKVFAKEELKTATTEVLGIKSQKEIEDLLPRRQ